MEEKKRNQDNQVRFYMKAGCSMIEPDKEKMRSKDYKVLAATMRGSTKGKKLPERENKFDYLERKGEKSVPKG